MLSPIQFIVSWAHRRRVLVVCGSLMLVLVSCLGLRRLSFDADVLSLLPRDGDAIPAFRSFLLRFGSLDQLFVVFTAPGGHAVADYSEDVDRWVSALRAAPEIEWVDPGTAGPDRDWAWLAEHQLLLLRGDALETALSRLQPAGMTSALASSRELLTMPSPAVAALVRQDPLDLLGLLRRQLGGQRAGITVGITEGGYVSGDGRRRLVIAKPRQPPFDTRFSHLLMQRLEAIAAAQSSAVHPDDDEPRPPLEVAFAGGHRIALETEAVVKRESILNGVGSLAVILPLLYLVFRSVWLLVCGALPSSASLIVALGVMGLGGATLSAAATGAAAMLFGLGIDGVVLVYVAHRLALAAGLDVGESVATLGGPSASMLLGMLTTAATFYGLVFVDFPSLQQLGLVIGHSMVACGVLTLVLVPALLPRHAPRGPIKALTWPSLASWISLLGRATRRRGSRLTPPPSCCRLTRPKSVRCSASEPRRRKPSRRRLTWLALRLMRDSRRVRWTLFFSDCRDFSIRSSASLSTVIDRTAWAISSAGSCHANRPAGPSRRTHFPRTRVRRAPSNGSRRRAAPRGG